MFARIARLIPAPVLRFAGRLQYRVPVLGPMIRGVASRIASKEGVIQRGVVAGLRFKSPVAIAGYTLGTTEPELQEAFARILKAGDVAYDLGANVGFYTLVAAHLVGNQGYVYAFEPYPQSAAAIRHNMEINHIHHVTVVEKAVADQLGVEWLDTETNPVTYKLAEKTGQGGMEVSVTSIDVCQKEESVRPPHFIKIDVEGAEERVLMGMKETLARYGPTILCEVHYAITDFEAFVERELGLLGYSVRTLDGSPIPRSGERFHVLIEPEEAVTPQPA